MIGGRRRRSEESATARLPFGRLVGDAFRTLLSRPGRTIGLGLAVALGVATAVGILSISDAANAQAQARIDRHRPEIVRLRPVEPPRAISAVPSADALGAAGRDRRIRDIATVQVLPGRPITTRLTDEAVDPESTQVAAVDGDLLGATRTTVEGRGFLPAEQAGGVRVAIVGSRVAKTLGLAPVASEPTVWIDGIAFAVVGVAEGGEHHGSVTEQVLVPREAAIAHLGDVQDHVDSIVYVRTDRGAAAEAAEDLPSWFSPERPERWLTEVPRSSVELAGEISEDLRDLTLAVAGFVLVIGVVAIANAMTRTVFERIPEIGLRRTLGARGEHIFLLLLTEAALIGAVAGLLGAGAGSAIAVGVAARNAWPLVLSAPAVALAVPAAFVSGVVGGLVPAIAAVRITPARALRRE